jgi:hypothetical protein
LEQGSHTVTNGQQAAPTPSRRWRIAGIALLAIVALLGGAYYAAIRFDIISNPFPPEPAPFPSPAETRDGRWEQDLDYLAANIATLHRNAFFRTSRADFDAQAADLRARISTLDDAQFISGMSGLLASLGDGHTHLRVHEPGVFRLFPIRLNWYGSDLVVTGAHPDYAEAIGARVTRIGETDVQTALDAVTPLIAVDNQQDLLGSSPLWLRTPEVLYALGILPDAESGSFTFERRDGETLTLDLPPVAVDDGSVMYLNLYDVLDIEPPLRAQNPNANYWYTYLEDSQTIYFHYFRCADDPANPFANFSREMFAFIDANPVQRVVIDLRFNGGGNSTVIDPFMEALRSRPALNSESSLFVLIGRGTFSSAMQNAIDFDTQTNARLIGEPTGGTPNGYGEVREFTLPNSGLIVQYSTRFFANAPGYAGDAYAPNWQIVLTWDDLLAGRDPALEAALAEAA